MTQILNRFTGAVIVEGDLRCADLSYADLRSADLSGADLSYADLRSVDLRYADLSGADLGSADLRSVDLRYADLSYADLRCADLFGIKIKKTAVFTGLYKYISMSVIAEDNTEHIRLGCHFRSAEDWANNFWNNPGEFPNNGDMDSKLRWMAYQTCLQWLELNRDIRE